MAEGEFFKKQPTLTVKEETKLIENFDDLLTAYKELKIKIDYSGKETFEHTIPLREELFGAAERDDDGLVGETKRRMKNSGIMRLEIAPDIKEIFYKIDEYYRWAERYFDYNEISIKGMDIACKSAFKIISNLYKDMEALNIKIKKLENQLLEKTEPVGHEEAAKTDDLEKERFKKLLDIRVDAYSTALLTGDPKKIGMAKVEVGRLVQGSEWRKECVLFALKKAEEDLGIFAQKKAEEQAKQSEVELPKNE